VVLVFSILITWAAHLNFCDFINFIMSRRWWHWIGGQLHWAVASVRM
jgi:uncharacterized membrane protein YdcZ (DUF606 family)